jgi:autotransporter-associated beta strand protein
LHNLQLLRRRGPFLAAACAAVAAMPAMAQLKSFSGAEGFGDVATGGRSGGTIYHVTNLNDSGTGSFRDAVSGSNRIIVFDVGGYIHLSSNVTAQSNLTILGQTAPGGGVGVYGAEVSFNGRSNEIVQQMRFRDGSLNPGGQGTGNSSGNCINLGSSSNTIFDHVSCEFASYNNIDAAGADNLTFQNSIVSNPINDQQFNFHWEGTQGTFLNNLFGNSHNRSILSKGNVQYVNNTVYNYQAGFTTGNSGGTFSFDVENNYFIAGPSTTSSGDNFYQVDNSQKAYATGNILDGNKDGVLNGSADNSVDGATVLNAPWSPATALLPQLSAADAYNYNINHAGASLQYDQVDQQVRNNFLSLGTTGKLYGDQTSTGLTAPDGTFHGDANDGYGTIAGGTNTTTIPLSWATSHGLATTTDADLLKLNPLGYRMIEQYAAEIADQNASQTWSASSGEWSTNSSNWTGSKPIVYDHALVRGTGAANGSLAISQGGAVAYSLSIGGNGPATGESVVVNGGSLTVYNTITIGDQNNGNFQLNSGTVMADTVQLGNTTFSGGGSTVFNGQFTMNGGVLTTSEIVLGGGTPSNWTTGGTINFNAGTIASLTPAFINAPIVAGGSINFDFNGNDGTLAGGISGTGTFNNQDTGVINLTGDNSNFNGVIVLKNGEISVNSDASAGGANASLSFQGGLLRINGTTLTSLDSHKVNWSTFKGGFDVNSASETFTVNSAISGAGSFTKSGAGVLVLGASNSYTGGTVLNGGVLAITNDNNIGGPTSSINFSGGELRILGTGITNLNSHAVNWSSFNGGFDIADSTNTFVINQSIGGNGALNKDGPGTLVLGASNSFVGVVTVNAGILRLGNPNAISNSTLNLTSSAGQLDLNGYSLSIGNITGSGGLDLKGGTFSAGSNNQDSTYSGVISDSVGGGNFVKTGTGSLTLTGTSTFPSTLTVQGGIVNVGSIPNAGSNGPLGQGSSASCLVLDGGSLRYSGTGSITTNRLFTLGPGGGHLNSGSGTVNWNSTGAVAMTGNGDRTLTLEGSQNSNTLTFALGDPAVGKTSLFKAGSGRWFIGNSTSAPLTYSGDTTVNSGTLLLFSQDNALPFGPGKGNLIVNSATFDCRHNQSINGLYGAGTVVGLNNTSFKTLTMGNGDASGSFSGQITSTLAIAKTGTGLQVLSGPNTYVGTTTISGGTLQIGAGTTSGALGSGAITNNASLAFNESGTLTIANTISGSGTLYQTGTGTTVLNATSTYTGATVISSGELSAGTIANGGVNSSIGASTNAAANLVLDGGTLKVTVASISTDRLFTLTSKGGGLESSSNGGITWAGPGAVVVPAGGNRTLTLTGTSLANNFNLDLNDPSDGKTSLTKTGTGRWFLGGNSRGYSGDTTVAGGTLNLNTGNVLPFGAGKGNVVITGGTLSLGNNNTSINALNGNGGTLSQGGTNTRSLTLGNGDASGTFSGVLTGSGVFSIVKTGNGTQALLGSNAWGGGTTVNAGQLIMSSTNDGTITVSGGTFQITTKAQSLDPTGTSIVPAIFTSGGKLDIGNNGVVVDWTGSSPIASIQQQIANGGITTSFVDANHAIGFGEASSLGIGSFGGVTVDTSAIVMRATTIGDANLDGVVNTSDFMRFANDFGNTGAYWSDGDFNGDGVVNALDFNALATHFGQTMSAPVLGTLVPEPGATAILGIGFILFRRRRITPAGCGGTSREARR